MGLLPFLVIIPGLLSGLLQASLTDGCPTAQVSYVSRVQVCYTLTVRIFLILARTVVGRLMRHDCFKKNLSN